MAEQLDQSTIDSIESFTGERETGADIVKSGGTLQRIQTQLKITRCFC